MKLGFIGLGNIGKPIALNLARAGFDLFLYTPSGNYADFEEFKSIRFCKSPEDASTYIDILLICVTDDSSVEDVLFSSKGAYKTLKKGSIVIDLSTISYKSSLSFFSKLSSYGILYVDSPVTGGTEGAINGTLTILVGGEEHNLLALKPIYKVIGASTHYFGSVGSGQKVKAINQILVAGTYASVAEAIAFGQELELPMNNVVAALSRGAGSSWALTNRSNNMLNDDYPLGFKLKLHLKDLEIALNSSEDFGLDLTITKRVYELEQELISQGFGDYDISIIRKHFTNSLDKIPEN